jgi:FkbH-like protein
MENLKYTDILKRNTDLEGTILSNPYQIGILSNLTVNTFKEILEYSCRLEQIEPQVEIGNFDNIVQDSLVFKNKKLIIIFYDMIAIVDQIDNYFEDIDDGLLNQLTQKLFSEIQIIFEILKSTQSVIFNLFSDVYFPYNVQQPSRISLFIIELNDFLKANAPPNFILNNIDRIYSKLGFSQCFDKRFYRAAKAPYTVNFFKEYSSSIQSVILNNNGKNKKAIIFDCDNTLWKGIIGEDGMDNIEMSANSANGLIFQRIQQIALYLSKRGILIGLCSKNNEADVLEVFRSHQDVVLKEENIVIHKISWADKASSLIQIASDLNIGVDSLIFVDDSSFEINLIKDQIPEILCIQVPNIISEFPSLLLSYINKYFNLNPTKEDLQKTEMYKKQFLRNSSKDSFSSIEGYLSSLGIEIEVFANNPAFITRIAQLTQKTNQFNLTTKRYTETEIAHFINSDLYNVYAVSVKDKFGESGLTGVCILSKDESNGKQISIDSFLMSCRIIGRNIEFVFLDYIIKKVINQGVKTIFAFYTPTKKNSQVAPFYDALKFQLVNETNDRKEYVLNLDDYVPPTIDYIRINVSAN